MKKLQIFLVSLFLTSYFLFPNPASAVGVSFGGMIDFIIPCPCSGGVAVFYAPLYLNSPVPITGALYYSPPSSFFPPTLLYSWYNPITPTVWNLGKFTPGVQECLVPAPDGCAPIFTLGSIIYEGTSGL